MEAKSMTLSELFGRICVLTPSHHQCYTEWGDHHWRAIWDHVRSAAEAELRGDTLEQSSLGRLSVCHYEHDEYTLYRVANGLNMAINIQIFLIAAEDYFYYSPLDQDDAAFVDMCRLTSNYQADDRRSKTPPPFEYKIELTEADVDQFDSISRTRETDDFEALVWDPIAPKEESPMSYAFLYFRECVSNWVIAGSPDNYWPGSPVSESRISAFREAIKARITIEMNMLS